MLTGLDTEASNYPKPEWSSTAGEPVAAWDPQRGIDSENEYGHWMYALGARWTPERPGALVVTDVKLVASNRPNTQCPAGYRRVGYWDSDGSGSVGTNGRWGHWDMALC